MDYKQYELSLVYKNPANIPIILSYPILTINNGFSVLVWSNEVEEFYVQGTSE